MDRSSPAGDWLGLPDMGQSRSHKHQVPGRKPGDVIPDNSIAVALEHQDQFILRVNMPGTIETGAVDRLEGEALFRFSCQPLKNRFHTLRLSSKQAIGRKSIIDWRILYSVKRRAAMHFCARC